MQDWQDYFTGVTWESLLADNLFFKSQVGHPALLPRPSSRESCRTEPDDLPGRRAQAAAVPAARRLQQLRPGQPAARPQLEFVNTLEYFLQTKRFGEHSLKFVSRFLTRNYETTDGVPGDMKSVFNGGAPDRRIEYFSNDPRWTPRAAGATGSAPSSGYRFSNSVADIFRRDPLPHRHARASASPPTRPRHQRAGRLIDQPALTPHLSAVWDMTHDGRTVVRGSYNQYVDTDAVRVAQRRFGEGVSQDCRWNPATGGSTSPAATRAACAAARSGCPAGRRASTPDGQPCRQKLKTPAHAGVHAGGRARDGARPGASAPTWSTAASATPTSWPRPTASGTTAGSGAGRAAAPSATAAPRPSIDLETPDAAHRSYTGVTVSMKQREGALKLTGSYTWSHARRATSSSRRTTNTATSPAATSTSYGPSPYDRRHEVRASAA